MRPPPRSTLFPSPTLSPSIAATAVFGPRCFRALIFSFLSGYRALPLSRIYLSTNVNSSHLEVSYAVYCLELSVISCSIASLRLSATRTGKDLLSVPFLARVQHRRIRASVPFCLVFFFNNAATSEIYSLSLPDALPIYCRHCRFWTPLLPRAHIQFPFWLSRAPP